MDENITLEMNKDGNAVAQIKTTALSDTEEVKAVSEQILSFLEENKPVNLVVDFEVVKFFSSQVLGVLINTRSILKESGGKVVISGINPQLYRVFRITNLDKIFKFYPDMQAAIKDLQENAS